MPIGWNSSASSASGVTEPASIDPLSPCSALMRFPAPRVASVTPNGPFLNQAERSARTAASGSP